jgi:hypothetical protein
VIVALYFWDVKISSAPRAFSHMALDRFALARLKQKKEISFFKLLGTGKGQTFTPRDADPKRWGLLVVLPKSSVDKFDNSKLINSWRRCASSEYRTLLSPIASHGQWAGEDPFPLTQSASWDGKIAAITRARIVPSKNLLFWRAVPPVTASLQGSPGLISAIGIGEAPIGLQGTFSIWENAGALRNFAYSQPAHQKAIAATAEHKWYAEELFARFAVTHERGELKAH